MNPRRRAPFTAKHNLAGRAQSITLIDTTGAFFIGCSTEGSYDEVVYCTECNAEISRTPKTIAKLQHKYTNYVFNNNATSTATPRCSAGS